MSFRTRLTLAILSAPLLLVTPNITVAQDFKSAKETEAARALVRIDALEQNIRSLTDRIERLEMDLSTQKAENERLAKIIDDNNAKIIALQDEKEKTEIAAKANNAAAPGSNSDAAPLEPPKSSAPDAVVTATVAKPIVAPPIAPPQSVTKPIETGVAIVKPIASAAVTPKPTAPAAVAPKSTTTSEVTPKPVASSFAAPKPAATVAPAPVKISAADEMKRARLQIQNGELDEANDTLSKIIKDKDAAPESLESRWLMGEIYFAQEQWLDATKSYISYINKDKGGPRLQDVLVRLASSYRQLNVPDQRCKAIKAYRTIKTPPSAVTAARFADELEKGECN